MKRGVPNLARDAQRVRGAIEQLFTRMAKRHKYTTGADLRIAAKAVVIGVRRAWKEGDPAKKVDRVAELTDAIDVLMLDLQLDREPQGARGSARDLGFVLRPLRARELLSHANEDLSPLHLALAAGAVVPVANKEVPMPTSKAPRPWKPAELVRMRSLARRGKSTAEAARALRRSPGALRYKAHVSGISFRELRA